MCLLLAPSPPKATLLFTSALKAVAKSHEIANRFNGGLSKKNRRREGIAAHHGRLCRKIVVLSEQAEVVQDEGFCAALMLCAAAAGDSSTVRAVYLASKVRRLDHLRTCGGKEHLEKLQGLLPEQEKRALLGDRNGPAAPAPAPTVRGMLRGGSSGADNTVPTLRSIEEEHRESHAAYENREYGTDTRLLSTLLLSHASAMEPKGLGSMWAGRYNHGYLCHNSLRYLEAYDRPQMENMAIKGLDSVEAGLTPEGWEKEDFSEEDGKTSKQLRKQHKFRMKQIMGDGEGIHRKDDMDSSFDAYDIDPQATMDEQNKLLLNGSVNGGEGGRMEEVEGSRDWLNEQLFGNEATKQLSSASGSSEDGISTMECAAEQGEAATLDVNNDSESIALRQVIQNDSDHFGNDFDSDSDSSDFDSSDSDVESDDEEEGSDEFNSAPSPESDREALVQAMAEATNDRALAEDLIPKDLDFSAMNDEGNDDTEEDMDFDEEGFQKLMADTAKGMDASQESEEAEDLAHIPGVSTDDYGAFQSHLRAELEAAGKSPNEVDENEARQLFGMMQSFYDEKQGAKRIAPGDGSDDESIAAEAAMMVERAGMEINTEKPNMASVLNMGNIKTERSFIDDTQLSPTEGLIPETHQKLATSPDTMSTSKTIYADDYIEWASTQTASSNSSASSENDINAIAPKISTNQADDVAIPRDHRSLLEEQNEAPHILELQQHLPGLPRNRIEKVSREFLRTLGYPSILRLALAVRENMPDEFSPQCLTRVNLTNAKHVMVNVYCFFYMSAPCMVFHG